MIIIKAIYIFQERAFAQIAHTCSRPCGIKLMSQGVGFRIEIIIIQRFIDAHAPHDNAGVIVIPVNHIGNILIT